MLTRNEFEKYKKEVQAFLDKFPKETLNPDYRIKQITYLFLNILEDNYTERD